MSEKGETIGCSTGECTGRVMFPECRRGRGATATGDMADREDGLGAGDDPAGGTRFVSAKVRDWGVGAEIKGEIG